MGHPRHVFVWESQTDGFRLRLRHRLVDYGDHLGWDVAGRPPLARRDPKDPRLPERCDRDKHDRHAVWALQGLTLGRQKRV